MNNAFEQGRRLHGQDGYGLLGLLALMGASLMVFLSGLSIIQTQQVQLDDYNFSLSASVSMTNMKNYMQNEAAWTKTLENADTDGCNASLKCLRDQTHCEVEAGQTLQLNCLYGASGTKVLDLTDGTTGFSQNGEICHQFSSTTPNPNCPFRYSMSWMPNCEDPDNCINPTYTVTATLEGKKPNNRPFNAKKFEITVMR